MTTEDIIEQAKQHPWWYSDVNMSTNLMHEVTKLRSELGHCIHVDNHNAIVNNRNAEIERLRASCERAHLDSAAFAEAMSEKSAEIERLRIAYEQERQDCLNLTEKVIPNLRSEIERLRSAANRGGHLAVANAEIERLREELLSRDNKLRAKAEEIERLRALVDAKDLLLSEWLGEEKAQSEIERLRQQVTQCGAKLQVMHDYLTQYSGPSTTLWQDFCRVHPEATTWFDEEGVPRRITL
jgi:chromosome segregation ATPase